MSLNVERSPVAQLQPSVALDAPQAVVHVDRKPLAPAIVESIPQRLTQTLRLDDQLFKKSALKGEAADTTFRAAIDRYFGPISWIGGGALGIAATTAIGIATGSGEAVPTVIATIPLGAGVIATGAASYKGFVNRFFGKPALDVKVLKPMAAQYAVADDVGRALIGQQAETWIARLNTRNVTGGFVRRQLQTFVDEQYKLPEAARASAKRIHNLALSLRDHQGAELSELNAAQAETIIRAVQAFPETERNDAAAFVLTALFRKEVCTLRVPKDYEGKNAPAVRRLLNELVANVPMPLSLPQA